MSPAVTVCPNSNERLMICAPRLAAKRMPAAISVMLPSPAPLRTRTGMTRAP